MELQSNQIFLAGSVPSSKNSQIMTKKGLFKSSTVSHYLQFLGVAKYSSLRKTYENYKTKGRINLIEQIKPKFLELAKGKPLPLRIGFYFIRQTTTKFDYANMVQILSDLFTAHDLIVDDNMKCFVPVFLGYKVDKDNAGVIISVL